MAAVTIRNLSDETHRALKRRAALRGNSTEAEIRLILDDAVRPAGRVLIGTELANFGRKMGGLDLDIRRDPSPVEAADFD